MESENETDSGEEAGSSPVACSPSPETDRAILLVNLCDADCADAAVNEVIHPAFARKLERERDEARKAAKKWRDHWASADTLQKIGGDYSLPWENDQILRPNEKPNDKNS